MKQETAAGRSPFFVLASSVTGYQLADNSDEETGRIKKAVPFGAAFFQSYLSDKIYILWHLMQSSVLKASLPLWQAPQDLPPLSMSPILALSAPALKGKILVWQSA